MATFGALKPPRKRLLHPYHTRVLCPSDLCPNRGFPGIFEGFCGLLRLKPLPRDGRGRGFDKALWEPRRKRPEVETQVPCKQYLLFRISTSARIWVEHFPAFRPCLSRLVVYFLPD